MFRDLFISNFKKSVRLGGNFLLVGLFWCAGLNLLAGVATDADVERQKARLDSASKSEAVLLGGSVAMGIDMNALGLDGAELWNPLQDLFETTAYANLLQKRDHRIKYWIVALSPPGQALDNGAKGSRFAFKRHKTYRTLRKAGDWELIDQDWRGAIRASVSLGDNDWIHLLRRVGLSKAPPLTFNYDRDRELGPVIDSGEVQKQTQAWREDLKIQQFYDPTISDRSAAALKSLNENVKSEGGILILISPPMHSSMSDIINNDLSTELAEFDNMLSVLAAHGAVVISDLDNAEFGMHNQLFRDTVHLNRKGAAAYSVKIARDLRMQDVLDD